MARRAALVKKARFPFRLRLGVVLPLKYRAGGPLEVKLAGSRHGGLLVVFCAALRRTIRVARWPAPRAAAIFVAALPPCGPFVVAGRLAGHEEGFDRGLH